jgi:hypothetical protein
MSTLLDQVKYSIGIYYSDALKDLEVQRMIDACKMDMKEAGVAESLLETPLAIDTIVLYCKLSKEVEYKDINTNQVYISNVTKLRQVKENV